jgi:Ankyrin repeats (many copies)
MLVAAGAKNDRLDNVGYTPLVFAIKYQHPNVAEYLLHSGAKMKNVRKSVQISDWMIDIITKRETVMRCTLVLKGLLKKRAGISKDVTHLIALYFWNTRLTKVKSFLE